ncbi:MAG: T9SS type A sorting domain-containing protein [Calditrichaceae bacterium]|nr:T9SS type A sorting domain-containing protein [Calditrichaceae bacterium]RQV93354.1 MAG: T9SS C-terminal target domain-containing protein [Calditrichota bacterium]
MKSIILMIILPVLLVSFHSCNDSSDKSPARIKGRLNVSKTLRTELLEQKIAKKSKPKFDKPDRAFQEMIEERSEIGKSFSYSGSWKFDAFRHAKLNNRSLKKSTALNWVERGPGNVGGRTRSIAVHPDNPDIWWVAAVGGGIWKTINAGENWTAVIDDMPVLSATTIDICQSNPDILYAGTGEGFWNYDAIVGDGIFKTTNGGASWEQLPSTVSNIKFKYINRIIVSPADPDIALAATNTGVYKTENGGDSWREVYSNNDTTRIQQIIANPLNFNTQYITVNGQYKAGINPGGIYKSTDGGETWQKISDKITGHGRIEMAVAPTDTNVIYASAEGNGSGLLGFFGSKDGGQTWTNFGDEPNWLGSQGWYDNTLIVSPLDANEVFAGGIDIYKATINDTSADIIKISNWYAGAGFPYVHADQHYFKTIQTSPKNFTIIAANDGGIHASYDKGNNWVELNNNYNVTQYYDADMSPSTYEFIGGTQDNGTNRSPRLPEFDSRWMMVVGGDGFDCVWDKTNPLIVYATLYYSRILKSIDGGYIFNSINNGLPESNIFHTPLAMDPKNSEKLFTWGENNAVYYTENGGENWNSVTINTYSSSRGKIAVSLSNSDIVWAGNTSRYLNVSVNGGTSFTEVADNPDVHAYLTGLATHPTLDSTAYMTLGVSGYGKIYRTSDLGQTWENITGNLPDVPVLCLLVMPFDTNELWAGTDIGLFVSYDNGSSWEYQNEGLPAVAVTRLKIVGQNIVAATHGRGIWSVFRPELSAGPLLAPVLNDLIVPNPNTGELKIGFFNSADYDSVHILVNNSVFRKLYNLKAATDTSVSYLSMPPEDISVRITGFYTGNSSEGQEQNCAIYSAINSYNENFNDGVSDFFGDFTTGAVSNFSTLLYHSEHPYSNSQNYISCLRYPINIVTGSSISYQDVAIVEPGEPGAFYPDQEMWDYVTVEGTIDGENWAILIPPYDARYNNDWLSAYNAGEPGTESMLQTHATNLEEKYGTGQKVYLRFRLYADEYMNGWGWAIDNIVISNTSGISDENETIAYQFNLIGNYPNPFNPSTTIRFTLEKSEPVTLHIYNALGQLIKTVYDNQTMKAGVVQSALWDGRNNSGSRVASGVYLYRLQAGENVSTKRMLLIR